MSEEGNSKKADKGRHYMIEPPVLESSEEKLEDSSLEVY